jgi:hypothetical protein
VATGSRAGGLAERQSALRFLYVIVRQALIHEHPANFHPVPRGKSRQVKRDAVVSNPPDLH